MNILTPQEISALIKQGYSHFYINADYILPLDYEFFINIYLDLFIKLESRMLVKDILRGAVNHAN